MSKFKYIKPYTIFENSSNLTSYQVLFLDTFVKGSWFIKDGLVNVIGDLICNDKGIKDFKGIRFNRIVGHVSLSLNSIESLDGSPNTITGNFNCQQSKLTSLIGGPKRVEGTVNIADNILTSLEGAPEYIGGNFNCSGNQLTSLKGIGHVEGHFDCASNELETLEGSPKEVNTFFRCNSNKLKTLLGGPDYVKGDFRCSDNYLRNLIGMPTVGAGLYCGNNELETLEGIKPVGLDIHCENNWTDVKLLELVFENFKQCNDYDMALIFSLKNMNNEFFIKDFALKFKLYNLETPEKAKKIGNMILSYRHPYKTINLIKEKYPRLLEYLLANNSKLKTHHTFISGIK